MGQSIKVQSAAVAAKPAVIVLAFHTAIYKACAHLVKTQATHDEKMRALLREQYGETVPTFEQYRADHKALAAIAKDKGLADAQVLRKAYNKALKAEYEDQLKGTENGLPEAQTADAITKRAERARKAALLEAAEKAAAEATANAAQSSKGANERAPTEAETVESIVTRVGLWKTLDACIAILAADEMTKAQALHLRRMADKARQEAAKAQTATA